MTLEEKIENIISEIQNAVAYAEDNPEILSSQRKMYVAGMLEIIKELIQECKPKLKVECICEEYDTEDCYNLWQMRLCGIENYKQNILKALEEK